MKGLFFIVLASFLWGVDSLIRFPLIQKGYSAFSIVLLEHFFLSLFFLVPVLKSYKKIWNSKVSHLIYFLIIGVGGNAFATYAFTKAFGFINPSVVILIQKTQPLVAISLAHFFLRESISKKFLLWAGLCFLGTFLISYKDIGMALENFRFTDFGEQTVITGYLLAFGSVLGWGASTVFGKKLSLNQYSEKEIMGGRFLLGFLGLMILYPFEPLALNFETDFIFKILLMVILSGMMAMYFYYKGLKKISARLCAIGELFFPLAAVSLNWVFLGVTLQWNQVLGGLCLIIGAVILQWKKY